MNGPLNTTNSGKSGTTNSAATDWAAKLSSSSTPAGGADQAAMQSDFSRWMARAAAATPQPAATASQLSANATAPAKASAGQGPSSTSVEARNALARAQANAAQAKRQAPVTHSETAHAPKAEKPKTASSDANKSAKVDASKGKVNEGADKADRSNAAGQDQASVDEGKVAATASEVAAKDQQPAESATSSDPSSMLAWLASLTHSAAKTAALGGDAQKAGADANEAQLQAKDGAMPVAATGHDALAAMSAATDKAAGAIDVSTLQAAEGRMAVLDGAADSSAKGADFANTLSTEMMRGLAGKTAEASATAQTSATLAPSVNSPEFPQALADRVGLWVNAVGEDGTMSAELHLNPGEMGPISVKISLDGQSAQVDFAAANLETRRAIEASLPMLSASLDDAGFSLGGSGVSDQSPQQQFNQASGQPGGAPAWGGGSSGLDSSGGESHEGRMAAAAAQAGRRGGLDLYA
ncbi:flagellar hook-length control protein FliK [Aquabacterium sp.]|uniref:flagellar hook-length control protein FliK n=1 Tax=Aquabacterium sp. TaxID=1872578 RepID=UPI00248A3EF9|nr:flagellar hook-length control protein FliK [Aquabacterium sp.]MDI1260796.1 flagellar hook-length control protein FliK [Aquabacterium sp.]